MNGELVWEGYGMSGLFSSLQSFGSRQLLDLMIKNIKASLNFVIVYLVLQNINTPKEACYGKE
jgi:hypothetical protein